MSPHCHFGWRKRNILRIQLNHLYGKNKQTKFTIWAASYWAPYFDYQATKRQTFLRERDYIGAEKILQETSYLGYFRSTSNLCIWQYAWAVVESNLASWGLCHLVTLVSFVADSTCHVRHDLHDDVLAHFMSFHAMYRFCMPWHECVMIVNNRWHPECILSILHSV